MQKDNIYYALLHRRTTQSHVSKNGCHSQPDSLKLNQFVEKHCIKAESQGGLSRLFPVGFNRVSEKLIKIVWYYFFNVNNKVPQKNTFLDTQVFLAPTHVHP